MVLRFEAYVDRENVPEDSPDVKCQRSSLLQTRGKWDQIASVTDSSHLTMDLTGH